METSLAAAHRASKRPCWEVSSPVDLSISPSSTGGYPGHLTPTIADSMSRMDSMGGPPSPAYTMSPVGSATSSAFTASRKPREFIPDQKKDDCYWDRRRRNNEAAKR